MRAEIRELRETFFVDDESCAFTFDGLTLQWRDNVVSVSNFLAIDFVHSGNCCSEKKSKIFFRKIPHKCEGHETMVLRYAEEHKKNRLRLASLKIRGEGKELSHWFRVLRCTLDTARKERAKSYLVFINPFSGRQNGFDVYLKKVKPLFDMAGIATTIVVTKSRLDFGKVIKGGIDGYDAILAVGGDGTVSEIVNSLISDQLETQHPGMEEEDVDLPKIDIPIGIIPCGSTDCVAYTLNGTRDTETNALHAILGNRTYFDVCRAMSETGVNRFFVSVFTYGYLSDLVKESEKFRWMGPIRYNYAGLLTLLRSKEYYGHVDLLGQQLGMGKSVHREVSSFSLLPKKFVWEKSKSLSLTDIPIIPTVEPGSAFVDTVAICQPKVTKDVTKWVGYALQTDVAVVESSNCEPSTSENGCDESSTANQPVKDELQPNDAESSQQLIPLTMELTTVEKTPSEEEFSIRGRYFLIACANISCSSEITPHGIAPDCRPGDGNMNVVLVQPNSICDLYKLYARLTSRDRGYPVTDLPFITIYQTKRAKISVTQKSLDRHISANCDGELFHDSVVDIKVHERVIQFYTRKQNRTS